MLNLSETVSDVDTQLVYKVTSLPGKRSRHEMLTVCVL
jgi:hypothetical protein